MVSLSECSSVMTKIGVSNSGYVELSVMTKIGVSNSGYVELSVMTKIGVSNSGYVELSVMTKLGVSNSGYVELSVMTKIGVSNSGYVELIINDAASRRKCYGAILWIWMWEHIITSKNNQFYLDRQSHWLRTHKFLVRE